jgi:hypothetical protein
MKPKAFDCVAMKRAGSQHVYDLTKNMSVDEELAFWKEMTAKLRRRQKALARRAARTAG